MSSPTKDDDTPEAVRPVEGDQLPDVEGDKLPMGTVVGVVEARRPPMNSDMREPPPPYDASEQQQQVQQGQMLDGQRVYVIVESEPPPPRNITSGRRERLIQNPRGGRQNDARYVDETGRVFQSSFTTTKIRNAFVKKVYLILSCMLTLTFGFLMIVAFVNPVRQFFISYGLILLIVFAIIYMAAAFTIMCCSGIARRVPINYILLGVVALSMTMVTSAMCALLPYQIILMAMGTCAAVCFLVSIFAIQTRWDVTGCGTCICIVTLLFMLFGLIMMIISLCGIYIKPLHIAFAGIGALLFSFWLMYDTQQIVGGRRYEISTEEYAFAALSLYIDVMLIFMYILDLYALLCSK